MLQDCTDGCLRQSTALIYNRDRDIHSAETGNLHHNYQYQCTRIKISSSALLVYKKTEEPFYNYGGEHDHN
jgi:hypothetical protein